MAPRTEHHTPAATLPKPVGSAWERWVAVAGGPLRAKVVVLLACVLGLESADIGSVGSIAGKLEHALHLSNTQLGLLAATPSVCAALATLPMGVLTDRTKRVRLLWITMLGWTVAQAASGLAGSFEMLLLTRIALGAATAAATPAVASLVGDLFPAAERARIWGLILSGELIGAAFGYVVAGESTTLASGSWRGAFFVLALPSLCAALALRRWLHEPARGGSNCLPDRSAGSASGEEAAAPARHGARSGAGQTEAQEKVEQQHVSPRPRAVLDSDPERMSLWQATRYVLRVPTNVVLILASALGYFYFTGVATFGLVFFEERYHVAHGTATLLLALLGLGGLVGVVAGGRLSDRWLHRGAINSRIIVGGVSYTLAAVLFLPGLLTATVAVSLPFFILAGVAFGARNPPLDAARLDIVHHRLWGRAEAVRTLLRQTMTATAPIVFGALADRLAPPGSLGASSNAHGFGANANAQGLRLAFLILLVTLAAGGILTFIGTRTFPRDVATALASEAAVGEPASEGGGRLRQAA